MSRNLCQWLLYGDPGTPGLPSASKEDTSLPDEAPKNNPSSVQAKAGLKSQALRGLHGQRAPHGGADAHGNLVVDAVDKGLHPGNAARRSDALAVPKA